MQIILLLDREMNLTTIILLIIAGLILLLLELVIPGGVVGTIGGIATIAGIILMYDIYGNLYGTISLVVSLIVCGVGLYFFFREKTWQRISLNDTIDKKLNKEEIETLKPGMRGHTITKCIPAGKAKFGDKIVEVHSTSEMIYPDTEVEIIRIDGNKIIVKPFKK
ncbi:MAG: NfeD family protein [Bacteroidales bacterium]|nr:NfeD family protein [Bacteroidales bacterium]MDD3755013.1 NfeD family protein [Bacteroidales bacterium]MDI9575993.1 NfeD family protein [Bacteroidota bacterium]MDY0400203.1 NfeD family protein [Bacteroidales bacterium]HHW60152.1 hypothetical protein [Bacteroidales bacterium]